jgi:SAM-dependent methyltransferase
MDVRESYDAAAEGYADQLFEELRGKPLDRHLLNRFAEELRGRGVVLEVGCGPGQISRFLHDGGCDVLGTDLSPAMVRVAGERTPAVRFQEADLRRLPFDDASMAGVVAFYAIVHFTPDELPEIFRELRRVLAPGGLVLVAFHAGDEVIHADELFGAQVSLDFRFHHPQAVSAAMEGAGLHVIETVEREPYEGLEHASRRCYLLARGV